MKALAYLNSSDKTISSGSGAWTLPTLTFGETLELALRFQENIEGNATEVSADVQYLKVAIGNLDARPESGKYCLKIGDAAQSATNTTAPLDWNAGAAEITAKITALTEIIAEFGAPKVTSSDESLLFMFGTGQTNVAITVVNDELEPPSLGLTSAWQVAGKWVSELRLVQTPAAFSDSSERILPAAPSVTEVQEGGADGTGYEWNEIQQLTMPPAFRGSYQFRFNGARSAILSRDDDTDAVAAALAGFGSGFIVTLPRDGVMRIEFAGDLKGQPWPLLEVLVPDAPEGDLTVALGLDRPPLFAMLRNAASVTLPLEIEVGIGDSNAQGGVRREKFQTSVTIQRGVLYGMLATAAGIDWLRPIATDYIPFTMDQIFRGQLYYAAPIGNGEATEFVIAHNLHSDALASVLVRQNIADGRVLVAGTDYTVTSGGADALTVTLAAGTTPPARAALLVVITAAGIRDSFLQHTHTMEQIVGLDSRFEALEQRVNVLEEYLPKASPAATDSTNTVLSIDIPARKEVLFLKTAIPDDLTNLPIRRAPALLPAVHTATVTALPDPLPSPAANTVWSVAAATLISGGSGIHSSAVPAGGFVASDGRLLYPASHAGETVSYFPTPFERTLWEFAVNDKMLRVTRTLQVKFGVTVQIINATSEAQWVLVIEQGKPIDQTDPTNEAVNLRDVEWNPTPILAQRILVSPLATTHTFGCQIANTTSGLTADRLSYGAWEAATGTAPESANFLLRARLINFDTKNNVQNATGWLAYLLGDGTQENKTNATATIQ